MRRRALLAAVGLLGAGCLDAPSGDPNETGTTTRVTDVPPTEPTALEAGTCDATTPRYDLADDAPDGAEYVVRDVSVATSYDRPETRYLLEPNAFYSADAVEREREDSDEAVVVMAVEDVEDEAVRNAIRTAIRDGEWRADEVPEGLADTVERVDFFTGLATDDTYTHIGVELHASPVDARPAVAFDAAVAARYVSPNDPGAVALWLANERETPYGVFSGTVPPFGMLHAERVDGDGRFLLWRDYEEEGCFSRHGDSWARCDIGRNTEIPPCESVVREYEILPSATEQYPEETHPSTGGTFRVTDGVSYSRSMGGQSTQLSFEVELVLESV